MKKVEKLTNREKFLLRRRVYLPGWQFEETIMKRCLELSTSYAEHPYDEDERDEIITYALKGSQNGEISACNFFVRHQESMYQYLFLDQAVEAVEAIKKQARIYREEIIIETKKAKNLKAA